MLLFDLRVNPGTPAGTLISNQAVVDSVELPNLLTDGDGNPATGPEPTVVVVGAASSFRSRSRSRWSAAAPRSRARQLEYVVRVTNIAAVPASNVVITDDLKARDAGQLTYVAGRRR